MDGGYDDDDGGYDLDMNEFLEDGDNGPSGLTDFDYTLFDAASHAPCADDAGDNSHADDAAEEAPPVNIQDLFPNAVAGTVPMVVGIIAQGRLGVGVDLRALSCATRNVEFIPSNRPPAATMRLHKPSAVVLVRNSGFMNIVGASSISEARQAAELAARIVRKALALDIMTVQFRVRSVMARFDVGHPIRLDELAQHPGVFCSYEPDRFSGCILRLAGKSHGNQWQVSCTVFVTGKVSMVGARSQEELRDAFHTLLPILAPYAKKWGTAPPSTSPDR